MHSQDDILDNAIRAVQEIDVPVGPSAELIARTRGAIREAEGGATPVRAVSFRWAAIVILATSALAMTWVFTRPNQSSRQANVSPTDPALVSPVVLQSPYVSDPPPRLVGVVRIEGHPPELQKQVAPAFNTCPHHHPPPTDESLLIGEHGGLANVVVSVSAGLPPESEYPKPPGTAVLDQKDCRYAPHVVAMQIGQELVAKNSDPFLHSVHTNPLANAPENIAQYTVDPVGRRIKPIKEAETFKVTCDLHPWMTAWVAAFDHPFFAVTRADGTFDMPLLPPGTYTLRAWHERLGSVEQQVTLTYDHKLPPVHFQYGPDRVAAAMQDRIVTAAAK
jgi:hypothetical protein